MTVEIDVLDEVLCGAASVRVSEIEWYGETVVDLARPGDRDRLRAAMTVASLPGYVCVCRGQVRFEFLDAQGERLDVAALPGPLRIRVREAATDADIELPSWAERPLLNA